MTISVADLKFFQSERMTDFPDGGGQMTGNEIVSDVDNQIFDDISDVDRAAGDVSIRKVYAAVTSADTDKYLDAGVVIFSKPADPSAPAKALPAAYNTPKTPIPSRHEPVTYASLQAAIDTAMSAQRDQEKREAFERGRSSFARLTPSKQSDAPRGGMGDAWSLRNASGKLVQAVLGVRKGESNTLPTNTAFRPFSASHKG